MMNEAKGIFKKVNDIRSPFAPLHSPRRGMKNLTFVRKGHLHILSRNTFSLEE